MGKGSWPGPRNWVMRIELEAGERVGLGEPADC